MTNDVTPPPNWKLLLKLFIGIPVGGFVCLFLYFLILEVVKPSSSGSVVDRAAYNCQQLYADQGKEAILRCENAVLLKVMADRERSKMEQASRGIR